MPRARPGSRRCLRSAPLAALVVLNRAVTSGHRMERRARGAGLHLRISMQAVSTRLPSTRGMDGRGVGAARRGRHGRVASPSGQVKALCAAIGRKTGSLAVGGGRRLRRHSDAAHRAGVRQDPRVPLCRRLRCLRLAHHARHVRPDPAQTRRSEAIRASACQRPCRNSKSIRSVPAAGAHLESARPGRPPPLTPPSGSRVAASLRGLDLARRRPLPRTQPGRSPQGTRSCTPGDSTRSRPLTGLPSSPLEAPFWAQAVPPSACWLAGRIVNRRG